jgi:hypothetical protein
MTIPSVRISNEPEEERQRERKKMPFIVATYVSASSQGQCTHSARTKISECEEKPRGIIQMLPKDGKQIH